MKIERTSAKQIRFIKDTIRHDLAVTVQKIYRSWGMSDTRFCRYMGKVLQMSTERVYLFLCRRACMHKELMEPGKLPETLEKVMTMYMADERVDSTVKEKAKQKWNKTYEQQMKKINELLDNYSLANKVASFREHDYELMEDLVADFGMHDMILRSFKLLEDFFRKTWPENSSRGLSYEETMQLKNAIVAVTMSDKYLSYMIKKYRNYKKRR